VINKENKIIEMIISKAFINKVYTEDELKKIILHLFRNKTLSATSKNQYAIKISQWISYIDSPQNLHNLISNPKKSFEALETTEKIKHSPSNHHIYISSVVAFIKYILKDEKLMKEWKEVEKENWKPIAVHYEENTPTELQKEKVIPFEDLMKIRETLEEGSVERLLLSFYTLIEPIRADYFATEIVSASEEPTADNYIVLGTKPSTTKLVVKDFKTKQKYEKIENTLSPELYRELKVSLEKTPRRYLFTTPEDATKPFATRKLFSNWACRTLTRILKQPMTLTVLRHIYITNKIQSNTSATELREIAQKMGHSRDIQRIYEWQDNKSSIKHA
jgi:integrase